MELLNDIRAAMTVIAFATFVAIVFWAYSDRRKPAFAAAARLPLDDDEMYGQGAAPEGGIEVQRSSE